MSDTTQKAWYVANLSGRSNYTDRPFASIEGAQLAAKSLARHHIGNKVIVLEVVDCYQAKMPEAVQVQVVEVETSTAQTT